MKWLFGGESYFLFFLLFSKTTFTDQVTVYSITKLLGESFKVHSHTLALSDDMGMTMSSSPSPSATPEAEDEMESEIE